jgi:hypothetical protein
MGQRGLVEDEMAGRFARSLELAEATWALVRADK